MVDPSLHPGDGPPAGGPLLLRIGPEGPEGRINPGWAVGPRELGAVQRAVGPGGRINPGWAVGPRGTHPVSWSGRFLPGAAPPIFLQISFTPTKGCGPWPRATWWGA